MPEYETRFCAFVDILGFKALVRGGSLTPDEIRSILRSVRTPPEPHLAVVLPHSDLRTHSFSDNICVSTRCNADGIKHLLFSLEILAVTLLGSGTLLRGAIVLGELYQDDEVVFGDALIRAVELEQSVVRYPRVMLERAAADKARELMRPSMQDDFTEDFIRQAADGPFFLNVLANMPNYLYDLDLRQDWVLRYNRMAEQLQRQLDASVDRPDIFEKHIWFAKYWNGMRGTHTDVRLIRGPGTDEITFTNGL